ncbi:MAG: ATP-binding cassette domain-containing protein [Bacteriovoracaceae bacterium]
MILQNLQVLIPEKIRELTQLMSQGHIGDVSVWVFLGLAIGILVFRTFSRLLFFYPARVQQKFLRMEMLGLLEASPPTRYSHRNQGQIFQILFDDINSLRAFVGFGLLQIGNLIIAAWVLIPKLNQTDSYLWPAFIPLFLSVVIFTFVTTINEKIFKKVMDKKGEVQQYIIESYEAKQTIKNFHQEENFIQGFVRLSQQELALFFKSSIGYAFSGPYIKLGLGLSLIWGALLVRSHGGDTSDLVYFSGFLYLFLEPVMFMSWVAAVLSEGFAAWRRVKELYHVIAFPQKDELEILPGDFISDPSEFKVNFSFWDKPISASINKNKWTVLIGETGCGKTYFLTKITTILKLKNENVSMVQQEPYLFNDTIQENIFLGNPATDEQKEKAKELLQMFQLDSLASNLDEVLSLEVGENGKRLSGGQMKRVALIRSLMSGASTLIWDDPFSSVDIILERKIINALKSSKDWNQKTFILSGHRLTTVRLSEQAIFLEREKGISLQGPVSEILKDKHVTEFFKEQMVDLSLA